MHIKQWKVYPVKGNPHYINVNLLYTVDAMHRSYIKHTDSLTENIDVRRMNVDKTKFAAITLNVSHDAINDKACDTANILFCKKFFTPHIIAHEFVHAISHAWRYLSKYKPEDIFLSNDDGRKYRDNNYYDAQEEFATILGNCVRDCLYIYKKQIEGKPWRD